MNLTTRQIDLIQSVNNKMAVSGRIIVENVVLWYKYIEKIKIRGAKK